MGCEPRFVTLSLIVNAEEKALEEIFLSSNRFSPKTSACEMAPEIETSSKLEVFEVIVAGSVPIRPCGHIRVIRRRLGAQKYPVHMLQVVLH